MSQPAQQQDVPGVQSKMTPRPDCGEDSYRGSGRLKGKAAVITGGDSGIGRAVAIAFAREGADVLISYLNEDEDAKDTARLVVVALHEKGFDFNPTVLVMSETSVVGALAYLPEDFDAVIAAMAEGRYSADGWVAEVAPDQLVHTFGELRQGRGTKVLVRV